MKVETVKLCNTLMGRGLFSQNSKLFMNKHLKNIKIDIKILPYKIMTFGLSLSVFRLRLLMESRIRFGITGTSAIDNE